MGFKVTFSIDQENGNEMSREYDDDAYYEVLSGGALKITNGESVQITNPNHWVSVEGTTGDTTVEVMLG